MKFHFIAIGGAVMHNLALDIHSQGHLVTGSDDEIFEPSKSRLEKAGILPPRLGWFPEKITPGLDAIILGMHAHKDNPELKKVLELGLKIYSYPEFIYQQSMHKKRIVVGGSHGKTTITSMIMHALRKHKKNFDYLVGAQLEGFEKMVKIDPATDLAVFEGDEYLSSILNPVPKFHLYHPHVAIISGISWDHMNVFPTFENYCDQFSVFIHKIEKGGSLIYCEEDPVLVKMVEQNKRTDINYAAYSVPTYEIINEETFVKVGTQKYGLQVFGEHNLLNMEAARLACQSVGMSAEDFYSGMQTFTGAAKRLELMYKTEKTIVFKDFAHSPSKLKATIHAVRLQYPKRKIYAFVELHTYSSLNKDFLHEYQHSMNEADEAVVFYSPHTLELKKLAAIEKTDIQHAFGRTDLEVMNNNPDLEAHIAKKSTDNSVFLMMSSGNWNGVNVFDMIRNRIDQAVG